MIDSTTDLSDARALVIDGSPQSRSTLVAQLRQFGKQIAAGLGVDGRLHRGQHRAGIQPFLHLHDGHAGVLVAGLDGAVDRRRAAPARQQRSVDVETSQSRRVQHPLRQDQAVRGDDHRVGVCGADRGARRGGLVGELAIQAQAAWLCDRQAVRQRAQLDRRGLQLHAAPRRAVRLAQHQWNLKPGREQPFQRHAGELRRTGKNDFHAMKKKGARRCDRAPWTHTQGVRSSGIGSSEYITFCTTPAGLRWMCTRRCQTCSITR